MVHERKKCSANVCGQYGQSTEAARGVRVVPPTHLLRQMMRAEVEGDVEVMVAEELSCAALFDAGPAPDEVASWGELVVADSVWPAFFLRTIAGRVRMLEWPRELLEYSSALIMTGYRNFNGSVNYPASADHRASTPGRDTQELMLIKSLGYLCSSLFRDDDVSNYRECRENETSHTGSSTYSLSVSKVLSLLSP